MKSNLTKPSPLTEQPGLHFWTVFGKATFMISSRLMLFSYSPPNFPQTLAITDYRCQPFWGLAEGSLTACQDLVPRTPPTMTAMQGLGRGRGEWRMTPAGSPAMPL